MNIRSYRSITSRSRSRSRLAIGPGSRRGILVATLLTVVATGVSACSGGSGDGNGPDARFINFDRQALLANLGENILLPVYRDFASSAGALVTEVDAYCAAIDTADEATRLSAAQDAWRASMGHWQLAEMMLFGPAALDAKTLRDKIYSWPVTSSCAIDQDVMELYTDPGAYDINTRLTNRRGLDALEYALFAPTLETTCPPQIEPAGWAALDQVTRTAARCSFAQRAAQDLAVQSAAVLAAWEPGQGNYLGDFSSAGESGSSFGSAHEAVNAVSNALFYADAEVKDMKLGQPAGIVINICNTVQEPCLDELESPFARHSRENIAANLTAFDMIFHGYGPGQSPDDPGAIGFDDFLVAGGGDALATTMTADIRAAIAASEAIPGSLATALGDDYPSVVATHTAVKIVTDNLKSQFLTILGLDLPDGAAGDND